MNIIFDIDGTLLRSVDVDDECFRKAFKSVAGIELGALDWSTFHHSTDAGLTPEIFERYIGRPPAAKELAAIRADFFERLARALVDIRPGWFSMPGAATLLDRLTNTAERHIAIATGGWRTSAEMKLRHAGLFTHSVALNTSDDEVSRVDILRAALAPGIVDAPSIYVGDRVWDLEAAAALGIGFLGVGREENAALLTKAGAKHVVPDFGKSDAVIDLLTELACAPRQ